MHLLVELCNNLKIAKHYITVEVENAQYPFPVMTAIHVKHGMNEGESFD